jgi:hypothetical protein
MWKKALLTIPAMLVGPAAVLAIFALGYDWSIIGAVMTSLIVSASAVTSIWGRESRPKAKNIRTTHKTVITILAASALAGAGLLYKLQYGPDHLTHTTATNNNEKYKHASRLIQAGQRLVNGEECRLSPNAISGLDRPFVAPDETRLEVFPTQLDTSFQSLLENEKKDLSNALMFLAVALAIHTSEEDPQASEGISDKDMTARLLVKLYRYAQKNGSCMTLRKYIELAEALKQQKPDWWKQYQVFAAPPAQ